MKNANYLIRVKLSLWLVAIAASCGKKNTPSPTEDTLPPPSMIIATNANARTITPTPLPTEIITQTDTTTPTETSNPSGYELKDWREPTEVITPENMNRVEKIGQLKFGKGISQLVWSPDGSKMGVVTEDKSYIMDALTFENLFIFDASFLAFSYDGRIVELGSNQYNMLTKEIVNKNNFTKYQGYFNEMEFSPNDDYIVLSTTSEMQIYAMRDIIRSGSFSRYNAEPRFISISPNSKFLAVNYRRENFTELWDAYKRRPIRLLKLKGIDVGGKPRFSLDNKSLFIVGFGEWEQKESIFLEEWDYNAGTPIYLQILPDMSAGTDISNLDISFISAIIAVGAKDGDVYLLPMRDCKAIKVGRMEEVKWVQYVNFRPDGKLFATSSSNINTIDLWGIPAAGTDSSSEPSIKKTTSGSNPCPKIPLIPEYPTPSDEWWAT